jgi:hypothetical protein
MARFKTEVKLFVLDGRAEGKGWKVLTEGIKGKFNIQPPTTRAMQKWEKNLDRAALSREFMKTLEKATPSIGAEAREKIAQDLVPILWQARDAGQDSELKGWMWFLSLFESQLGPAKFEYIIKEYMRQREAEKH